MHCFCSLISLDKENERKDCGSKPRRKKKKKKKTKADAEKEEKDLTKEVSYIMCFYTVTVLVGFGNVLAFSTTRCTLCCLVCQAENVKKYHCEHCHLKLTT